MQKVIEALQKINDSDLEILVAAYLRRQNPQLKGLIATGINENGQPIPCPVDNILIVSSMPAVCYSVATTKINRPKLRNKWLGENQDFEKALREMREYKKQNSDVHCILYLATNHFLKSDTELYRDVISLGEINQIEVEVIEASILVDFLQFDADGQYIGFVLLGIEPSRLSYDLLHTIANESFNQHERRFPLQQSVGANIEIHRDVQDNLLHLLSYSSSPLIGLRGASGTGKSTLLRQLGRYINANGGVALWIPAENISPNVPLNTILLEMLRRYRPDLHIQSEDELTQLTNEFLEGFVLLVDDINRAENSERTLAGLNALGNEIQALKKSIRLIVPMWPGQLAIFPNSKSSKEHWTFVELGTFSESEREQFSTVFHETKQNNRTLLDIFHGDPFLCGLITFQNKEVLFDNSSQSLQQIFEDSLQAAFREAQSHLSSWVSTEDINDALNSLIKYVLNTETPEPLWRDIQRSIEEKQIKLLIALAQTNQIGWIDGEGGRDFWRWKHTRLRDGILGRWLAANIFPLLLENNTPPIIESWLRDPGLADAFAIAFVFTSSAHETLLTIIGQYQPLILVELLRLNLFPKQIDLRAIISKRLRETLLIENTAKNDNFVDPPINLLLYKLAQVNDMLVLDITSGLKSSWFINLARFRNGDLDAGVQVISKRFSDDFLPHINFPFLETIISEFALQRDTQRKGTISDLANKVKDFESANIILYIASIMHWPELIESLWDAWGSLSPKDKRFSAASMVWFLSNFGTENIVPKLKIAFTLSLELSDEKPEKGRAPERYNHFTDPLRLTLWRSISSVAAEAWTQIITSNAQLWESTGHLLGGIDHPAALEAYIRWQGKHKGFGYWDETSETIDPLAENQFRHVIPVLPESRQHVWNIFLQEKDEDIRREAFYMWRRSAKKNDLPNLRKINAIDPLFDNVLKLRLKIRDKSAVPIFIQKIKENPGHWCRFAPILIDEPGVFDALNENLETTLESVSDWGFSVYLFKHLPHQYLKLLISHNRTTLLQHQRTWPSLWLSGEPTALRLVQEGIRKSSSDELRHFFPLGGWEPITSAMLQIIEPVLTSFDSRDLENLARELVRQKKIGWLQEYLPHIISEKNIRSFAWLTFEEIISTLDEAANLVPSGWKIVDHESSLRSLEISFEHGDDYVADIMEAMKIWLNASVTVNKLVIAARILSKFGEAKDINWWLQHEPEDDIAKPIWEDALFHLKLRRWQES